MVKLMHARVAHFFRIILLLALGLNLALADDSSEAREKADKAFQKGDFAAAIGFYTITVSLNPHDASAFYSRGASYANMGQFPLAIADFNESIKLKPQWDTFYTRGRAYENSGKYGEAIADFYAALALKPDNFGTVAIQNELAWLLATCTDDTLRDGKKAVSVALSAWKNSGQKSRAVMDTLAAAYAEAGDFVDAAKWEQQFLATRDLTPKEIADANARLELYKQGEPYHEKKD
jgi:tetratricopeptide (TPR) repeat protein